MRNCLPLAFFSLNLSRDFFSTLKAGRMWRAELFMLLSMRSTFIRITIICCQLLLLLLILSRTATAYDGVLKLTTGAEYISGDFGGTQTIDEWYIPFTARYFIDDFVFRLTAPLLSETAPEGTITLSSADTQVIVPGTGERTTETGIGDVIAGITYRDALSSEAATDTALDLTAKVKIATADEDKGLGTGENDYIMQAELYKFYSRSTSFGILGYKVRGDPPGVDLNNSLLAMVGGNRNGCRANTEPIEEWDNTRKDVARCNTDSHSQKDPDREIAVEK